MKEASTDNSLATYKRLLGYTKKFRLAFFIAVVANLFYAAMESAFVWFFKPLIDDVFVPGEIEKLKFAPLILITVLLVRGVAAIVSTYCMSWVGFGVVQKLREELIETYMSLPIGFFQRHSSGRLISKVTYNVQQVANASSDAITSFIREGGLFIFLLASLFYINWRLACIYFVSVPIIAWLASVASKRFKSVSKNIQNAMGDVTQSSQEIVEGYKVIKTYSGENFQQQKFNKIANKNRRQNLKLTLARAISVPVIQLIAGAAVGVVIYFAINEFQSNRLTAGELTTMLAAMIAILKPLKMLSNLNVILQQGIAGAQDIFTTLDESKETNQGGKDLTYPPQKIALENICFSYQQDQQIIKNLSFNLYKGKTVALVGRSGSGKSTLINLLLRFYQPDSGRITIDDIDIKQFSLESLRKNIAYVSQQVVLFADSIQANIAYADKNPDQQRLIDSANKAHAMEFIQQLDGGFDYHIGENGNRLSGGQKQRIAIARAIYKNSPIILLDEATSALDTESERHIQAALEELTKERTTLVIAHRLTTIEKADNIIVMHNGKIAEQGTHHQLIANNSVYAALHANSFSEQQNN